jgi:predicted transcriptional regulator
VSNRRRPPSARDDAVAHHPAMRAAVLHYLKEVARGSSRKADDALNIASSAINRQISKLDADLGVRLSDRMPDGMRLTSEGEVLLRHVRATLRQKSLSLVPFIDDDYACSVAPCSHASSPTRSRC